MIHNRMPVILPRPVLDRWLDPQADVGKLQEMLVPLASEVMDVYEVSTLVPCCPRSRWLSLGSSPAARSFSR